MGFTLLEVAVALAILGAGVVTCLQIFTGSLQLQARASRQLRVAMAARSKMDSLFAQELRTGCREDPPNAEGFLVRSCVAEAGPQDGIVLPDGIEPAALPLVLEVNVAWQDARGVKNYTLRSMRLPPPDAGFEEP
jgi:prepilin-type N-terminal cleavage/methylation domain-containing protein